MKKILAIIGLSMLFVGYLEADIELPDLGSPNDVYLSKLDEPAIGRAYFRNMRQQGQVVEDPLLNEYLQDLGSKLSSKVQDGDFEFNYFFVPQNSINAFAMPGGYIGIHTGLCVAADNESQLASVLAHEISHVTQRHISRQIGDQVPNSIQGGLILLGAILIGAMSGNSEVVEAGAMVAPSIMSQNQIDFTREMEIEADAIGIKTLGISGYDPYAMSDFFEKLSTGSDPRNAQSIEFLRTHPTSVNRSAAAKKQARRMTVERKDESLGFELSKARIRHFNSSTPEKSYEYFSDKVNVNRFSNELSDHQIGNLYGLALSMVQLGLVDDAEPIINRFLNEKHEFGHFHILYADLMIEKNESMKALKHLYKRLQLSPRNIPLTIKYAELELSYGEPKKAHDILLDLFNNKVPTPSQIRLIANAANDAGQKAEAFSYMAEFYLSIGNFQEAIEQLKIALTMKPITNIQTSKYIARLSEVEEYLYEMNKGR
jgi:predicted Zn-dependent protease